MIYHQALERTKEERVAFVARACGRDEDLRHEVENLLSFDGKAGRFIESPALDMAARVAKDVRLVFHQFPEASRR